MQAGGAAVSSSIAAQAGMQEAAEVPVQVRDRGTGLYELQFTLAQVILQLQRLTPMTTLASPETLDGHLLICAMLLYKLTA